jgi:hypothetical protein
MTSLKVPMSIYFFDIVQLWMFSLWWVNVFSLFILLIDVHYLLNFPLFYMDCTQKGFQHDGMGVCETAKQNSLHLILDAT